jgi:hypothetical protein
MLPFMVTKPVTKQEISIALDAHEKTDGSWRELTNRNLFSVRLFECRNRTDCSASNRTSAEYAWIRNRGMRFEITQFAR